LGTANKIHQADGGSIINCVNWHKLSEPLTLMSKADPEQKLKLSSVENVLICHNSLCAGR
jgi:hypothetical protein